MHPFTDGRMQFELEGVALPPYSVFSAYRDTSRNQAQFTISGMPGEALHHSSLSCLTNKLLAGCNVEV